MISTTQQQTNMELLRSVISSIRRKLKHKERNRKYRISNPQIIKAQKRRYRLKHKDRLTKQKLAWKCHKRQTDPLFKIKENCRNRIWYLVKTGFKKNKHTIELLGCDWLQFKTYLECKFKPGMSWDNYGTIWDIDHVIPLASAKDDKSLESLFHYTNCQPLWQTTAIARKHGDSFTTGNRDKGDNL